MEQDAGRIFAAIQVIGDRTAAWDGQWMTRVLESYCGETANDETDLVQQHLDDHWPGFPLSEVADLAGFIDRQVIAEKEVCAENPEGGTLYFFNKNKW